jgi:hypothetical protein
MEEEQQQDRPAQNLPEVARNLSKLSRTDHTLNVVTAALNAVPVVGGSISHQ